MKRDPFFALTVVIVVIAAGVAFWYQSHKPAPDFSLQAVDGRDISLSDLKGNVVLLDFWATWCPPCRASLPHIQHLSQDRALAGRGLRVLAINSEAQTDTVRSFLQQNNYTFTVAMDPTGKTNGKYGVSAIPTTILVGRDGAVKKTWVGFGPDSAQEIDDAVASALDDHPAGN